MKKAAILIYLLFAVVSVSSAEEAVEEAAPAGAHDHSASAQGQGEGGMMMPGMMDDKMKAKMKDKMKGMHQQPTLVATSDGGVVILNGPRLVKYDAMLELVGEVELKPGPKPGQKQAPEASQAVPLDEQEVALLLDLAEPPPAQ